MGAPARATTAVSRADLRTAEILDRAAAQLAPDGAWTQGALARAADGAKCGWGDKDCVALDLFAALHKGSAERPTGEIDAAADLLRRRLACEGLQAWNDTAGRTQAEVVAACREAAAALREGRA